METPALKAVMIVYNQAQTEKVEYMLDRLGIRGYTQMENVKGRGSLSGEPHYGTHTWPEINSAVFTIIPADILEQLLGYVKRIDSINEEVGIRAFAWDVTHSV